MKVAVIGGSGFIGTTVVNILTGQGHKALAASPSTGVEATTDRGLAEALARMEVVGTSRTRRPSRTRRFLPSSSIRAAISRAEREAGVRHHVALSVVDTDRLQDSGYFRAKLAQERLIKTSGIPYTIIRATQFFEFLGAIAAAGTEDNRIRLSNARFQPIAIVRTSDFAISITCGQEP